MKAAVATGYGPPEVVEIQDLEKPTPRDDEVLIKVRATTVTSGDWRLRSRSMPRGFGLASRLIFGLRKLRRPVLGTELAGEIESVGSKVTAFNVGDQVFAFSDAKMGCHAEYKCMPEDGAIASKPSNLNFVQAAALSFGGTTALDFFRRGQIKSGETVLINGASGGVGTAAVQLAKHFGAYVTGVCSTDNVELVKSIGADRVIDYTREDVTRTDLTFDIIVDTAGTIPMSRALEMLNEEGRFLLVLGTLGDIIRSPLVSMTSTKKVIAGPASGNAEDLRFLAELAEAGTFRPVIDRRYPFEEIVEAHRYVDMGHKKGNVVVTLDHQFSAGD